MSLAWLKADVLVGSIGKLAAASLLFATLGFGAGCSSDPAKAGVAKGCTLNSDCSGGLVCSFGLCHKECEASTDCPAGQRCVQSKGDSNVCQLSQEKQCDFNTDCSDPLICAIDRQCRNQCKGDKDCLMGQRCADEVCADPQEVNQDGGLKGAVGGAGGEGNTPSTGGSGGKGGSGGSAPIGGENAGGEGGMPPATCTPGGDCVPEGMPCQLGTVTCDNNVAGCMVTGDADDGTECDTDKVCSTGVCTACKVGDACQPDPNNVCVTGTVSCATGPACDGVKNVTAGTSCDTDKVCAAGSCVACKVDDPCDPPGQACKNGKQACANGPVCNATTTKAAGTTCDTGKVCDSGAICVACVQNGTCSPGGNTCHIGVQDCSSGPNCIDTLLAANDGLTCTGNATYNFCTSGACVACLNGNPCIPTNPCHKGTLNCGTATPTCNDSQANAVDGLACGDNESCISGECLNNDRTLTVTSGAVADVPVDAPFATVTITLVDKDNAPVPGAVITVTPPPGGTAAASNTSPLGKSQITGRVSRALGMNQFTVSAPGATSIQFSVNAVAPTDDNIFTLVNINHLGAVPTTPVAGTISKLYSEARAVAAAADGTLYVADYAAVYKLTTQGVLARIAGDANEAPGDTGDNGPATSAKLYAVTALALDETKNFLYVADSGYPRVRLLDLKSGKIYAFAGSSSATNVAPWGDTGPADAAYVNPSGIAVAPNGDVFISDASSGRIRRVDSNNTIDTFLAPTTCGPANPVALTGCFGYGDGCSFAWDKAGQLYISGQLCHDGLVPAGPFRGVARVTQDVNGNVTALTHIAGTTGPVSAGDGGTATSAAFTNAPGLAFDKAGNLFLTTRGDHRVRRIDSLTDQITTVAGTGTPAYSGDYVLGNTAQVSYPTTIAFDGANNLYFADSANLAIRTIWNVGDATPLTGKLATTGGTGQTVKRDAPFAPLAVKVTDGSDAPIPGVPVNWKRLETGSGLSSTGADSTAQATTPLGASSMPGRVGLASGDYHFEASFTDIHGTPVTGSPQTFTVTATDPTAGNIFPVVNYGHTSVLDGAPGPATFATLQAANFGVAAATDGTIYVSDYYAVYKITNRGELSVFAGTPGQSGSAGDSGPAVGAKLTYPRGLAIDETDETNRILYIAESGSNRIRAVSIDTSPPKISTFAGGTADNGTNHGDGGPAVSANLASAWAVTVGPDGKVYIPDSGRGIRVVDALGNISTWFPQSYQNGGCVLNTPSFYYTDTTTAVRFAANGDAYIGGRICEGATAGETHGIVLRSAANGTFTRIAGLAAGSANDNVLATAALLPGAFSDFIIDGSGNLVLALYTSNEIRRIDMSSKLITTIAGDGTGAYSVGTNPADYVSSTTVRVYNASKLALWPGGHVLIADEANFATRMIW